MKDIPESNSVAPLVSDYRCLMTNSEASLFGIRGNLGLGASIATVSCCYISPTLARRSALHNRFYTPKGTFAYNFSGAGEIGVKCLVSDEALREVRLMPLILYRGDYIDVEISNSPWTSSQLVPGFKYFVILMVLIKKAEIRSVLENRVSEMKEKSILVSQCRPFSSKGLTAVSKVRKRTTIR
ncbi:uncharacterized protein PHALS_02963 [Plasmopara halstedii]|uniref:Uncharacterized protein n=1 Tax=Plasmopara halstedii TaxID=4781 RepID=A0A0P1AY58_PLAHL|nr:uncharacterized protein PHALS_02963 [Plasmopara halstedii]CEG46565.1 hypothetical protein PHALS_02963 [Plasmopara halstedii]|eukprot:XP_024582934.1 hypothetical protein PHALS_02963 [Plasmopara halstedii]